MTVSNASASALAEWLNADVRIEVVGNGASAVFSPHGEKTRFDRPTFIYVGNLKPHKNVDVIFNALELRPEYDILVVTADGAQARSRADERQLGARVQIAANLSDDTLAALYRGATGVLQASTMEGFGLPVLEAMSCGSRVAYWAGCESVAEICSSTGVAVQSASDAEEWAQALDALATQHAAGPLVMPTQWASNYDWDAVSSRVSRVLAEVTA